DPRIVVRPRVLEPAPPAISAAARLLEAAAERRRALWCEEDHVRLGGGAGERGGDLSRRSLVTVERHEKRRARARPDPCGHDRDAAGARPILANDRTTASVGGRGTCERRGDHRGECDRGA